MNPFRFAAYLAIAALLAVVLAFPVPAESAKLDEGDKAAEFTATDFLTNEKLDLGDDLGTKVILLDFGSIYCSSCMVTVPNLIKLRKRYAEDELAIYNIYLDIYNPQRVIKFFRGFGKDIRLHLTIDEKLAASREYGIDTLPTTVIIDRSGTIRRRIVGYTEEDEKEIDELVENLVREKDLAGKTAVKVEEEITIFVPDSFTKTNQNFVYIVGYIGGEGTKDVALKLNNLPPRIVTTKDNIFHFRTPLSLAMNLIEVKGQVGDGVTKSQSLVLFRETAIRADIRSELPAYRFHREEEKKPCAKCHESEVALQDKSTLQQSKLCSNCHVEMGRDIYTHGPITVGGCLPCHDYQSFPNKYELRTSGPNLCYSCHDKVRDTIRNGAFVHGPTAAGMCVVCHDPHGANEKFLLRKRGEQLCINCHQGFLRVFSKPNLHKPVEDGDCTGCHDPHAAGDQKMLVLPKDQLCGKCHTLDNMSHMHRVGDSAQTEFPPETPVDEEGLTICYTCHLFHAGDLTKLWRGTTDDECGRGCHDSAGEEEEE